MQSKQMKIVIVGGGIIGAALARSLCTAGADVTLFEGAPGATPASFGWVNASFFLTPEHFALRAEGLAAWRRLGGHVTWAGCLCWEETGAAFDAQRDQLCALGYAVEEVTPDRWAALEPDIAAPPCALHFAQEGVAAPADTVASMLRGVRRVSGVRVLGLTHRGDRITGIETAQGHVPADRVIVAAGIGSPDLLSPVGVDLPMLRRPGLMLRTAPVRQVMRHILVAPGQELRQEAQGHIWAPTAPNHQSDDASEISDRPDLLADAALERVQALVPGHRLTWEQVMLAERPVPRDGLPVIGACGPEGLFVAVMHSGITLAAITAEVLAPQVLDRPLSNAQAALTAPFTSDRFQSG
ncbi:FAD-dependent oxidoreductase [uncultured Tateyamaria sp.]|uniref:NAD(P)/FAD-dependent oxidoreductase n=1 Tax=uncultured Tateyamaria sp. TaxID=455651 RepID=UPI00260B851C|nr:FAD-dependent oxidoreductase [uncultured Tateyamaria sp.]